MTWDDSEDLTDIIPNPENLTEEEKKIILESQYKKQIIETTGYGMEDSRIRSNNNDHLFELKEKEINIGGEGGSR